MTSPKTHYDNLQVACSASDVVIKSAFRALSQKHHPDKNPDNQEQAERNMQIINAAFTVLSDPARRREYDDQLEKRALAIKSAAEANANDAIWMEMKQEQELAASYAQAVSNEQQNPTANSHKGYRSNPVTRQLSNIIIKLDILFSKIGWLLGNIRRILLSLLLLLPWLPLLWIIKAAWEPAYGNIELVVAGAGAWLLLIRMFFPNSWIFAGTLIHLGWRRLVEQVK